MKQRKKLIIMVLVVCLFCVNVCGTVARAEGAEPTIFGASDNNQFKYAVGHAQNGDIISITGEITLFNDIQIGGESKHLTIRRTLPESRIILAYGVTVNVMNVTFDGGGQKAAQPFLTSDAEVTFSDCSFQNFGNSEQLSNNSSVGGAITGNQALDFGGGVSNRGTVTISGAKVYDNSAVNGGADIATKTGGNTVLTDSVEQLNELFSPDGLQITGWVCDYDFENGIYIPDIEPTQENALLKLGYSVIPPTESDPPTDPNEQTDPEEPGDSTGEQGGESNTGGTGDTNNVDNSTDSTTTTTTTNTSNETNTTTTTNTENTANTTTTDNSSQVTNTDNSTVENTSNTTSTGDTITTTTTNNTNSTADNSASDSRSWMDNSVVDSRGDSNTTTTTTNTTTTTTTTTNNYYPAEERSASVSQTDKVGNTYIILVDNGGKAEPVEYIPIEQTSIQRVEGQQPNISIDVKGIDCTFEMVNGVYNISISSSQSEDTGSERTSAPDIYQVIQIVLLGAIFICSIWKPKKKEI